MQEIHGKPVHSLQEATNLVSILDIRSPPHHCSFQRPLMVGLMSLNFTSCLERKQIFICHSMSNKCNSLCIWSIRSFNAVNSFCYIFWIHMVAESLQFFNSSGFTHMNSIHNSQSTVFLAWLGVSVFQPGLVLFCQYN